MEDLKELRRLAEIVASHEPDFKDIHDYLEALRNMQGELSGTTVLALLSRLEQAEQAVQRVREMCRISEEHAQEYGDTASVYVDDLKLALRALDGHTKQLGGTPTGELADVCSCGKSYWPCIALGGDGRG